MKEAPNQFLDEVRERETDRVSQLVIASINVERLSPEGRADFAAFLLKEDDNVEELINILRSTTLGREVVDLLEIDLAGNKISVGRLKKSLSEAFREDLEVEQPAAA